MAKLRLRDPSAPLQLIEEIEIVVVEVDIDLGKESGDDAGEKQSAGPWRGHDGQMDATERHASSRGDRARVEDLELGERLTHRRSKATLVSRA